MPKMSPTIYSYEYVQDLHHKSPLYLRCYLSIIFFLPMCYTWLYLVTLSWTFEVVTCIGVPAFEYRFPTVIDVLPIELYCF